MRYHHIVLFRLKEGVSDADRRQALTLLKALGSDAEGLESWQINKSLDTRKGNIIIEEAVFSTEEDFTAFRESAKHNEVGRFMRRIADWWVGDYTA